MNNRYKTSMHVNKPASVM